MTPRMLGATAARVLCCGILLVGVTLSVTGCGGADNERSVDEGAATEATAGAATSETSEAVTTSDGATTEASETSSVVAEAEQVIEELATPTGSYTSPPTTGPKATSGKTVWVIGFGNFSPASVALEREWKEQLAPALGWTVKYVDGEGDPNVWLAAIRDAINANADGIVTQFVDCPSVKSGLKAANEAGIPVISINGEDCADSPLFAGVTTSNYGDINEANAAYGEIQASWVIADSNGTADVVSMENVETAGSKVWTEAWKRTLEKCEGCKVDSTVWSFADLGPELQQKTQQALLQNPDANYVFGFVDDAIAAGIAAGIKAANRDVKLVGFDCDPNVLKLMKGGEVDVCFTATPTWPAWAAADGLVRVFAGEEPVDESGRGLMLVTPEINFPSDISRYPEPDIDFRAIYRETWGAA